ncbi:PREDICTED: arginine/serine-rich coiled-coil protein 2 isoform X1 [Brassica oleracea var. oleracea]|uniref:arginine/serine-rich coiled-coil protein 2 isoform X1 n=1 Tax=Brassica oleracea var. oleracea TaxID=109376 RepID=UPI0006A72631|nr:PREDICTED: arginine/serine-rich coiled-coil protein 2 isoform X1 [Brassica oleracea var. oleracea]
MDTELNSPPHQGGAVFKKPSNDESGRKYRRRALADDGSSSSDGSPERDQISKQSREDVRKVSEPVHARREDRGESDDRSRYGRGGIDSHRHDRHSRDDHYRSKRDEYDRHHERDGARSSRDSRSDHRRAEKEHNRSKNDSDRHSRRKHADSRAEDKEKDYVKRGSRWTFGDRQSRDEKEHEDLDNKEKDVYAKSPRDRPDGATENRDAHSKKLKGFVSEKFTHGNTNAEEKHTSRFKPALCSGNQDSSLQSHSKGAEASGDVDAAKVAAMQAAELVNKNLVGTGYLTTDQKKKLLWGKKKSTATEEPAHRWDSALVGDRERQEKFNKLMSLRLRWCIIVGCERECSKPRAEPKRSPSRETERVAEGSRETVHSRIKEERRTYGGVRSLNLFDKLSSYSRLFVYLKTLVASPFCNLLLLMSKP